MHCPRALSRLPPPGSVAREPGHGTDESEHP